MTTILNICTIIIIKKKHAEVRGIGSSMSSRQQAAAVSQETGGWHLGIPYREGEVPVSLSP
jgi:hypothetical protein